MTEERDVLSAADVQAKSWLPAKLREEAGYFAVEPDGEQLAAADPVLAGLLNEAADLIDALGRAHEQMRGERDAEKERADAANRAALTLIEDANRWSKAYSEARDELAAAVRVAGCAADLAEALRRLADKLGAEVVIVPAASEAGPQ